MSKINYKSIEQIELIRESSLLVSKTLGEIAKVIRPGIKTIELNKLAETFIRDNGGIPAFLNYHGFPYSLCISMNDQVVHGFPGQRELVDGDLVSVDCGVELNKYIGDSAYTPYSLCISLNDQVVHGFPGNHVLKDGDLVSVDCGVLLNKYYGDSAFTFAIGEVSDQVKTLMRVTRECIDLERRESGSRNADRRYRFCRSGAC